MFFRTLTKHNFYFQEDTTQILWALGPDGSDGQLPKHVKSGARPLRLLQPVSKPESIPLNHWDVRLTNVSRPIILHNETKVCFFSVQNN